MRVTRCSTYKWDVFNPSKPYITITPVIKWGVKFWIWIHRCIHRFHGTIMKTMAEGGPLPVVIKVLTPLIWVKWPQVPNYVRPFIIGAHLADESSGVVLQPDKMFARSSWPWLLSFFMIWGWFFSKKMGPMRKLWLVPKKSQQMPCTSRIVVQIEEGRKSLVVNEIFSSQ